MRQLEKEVGILPLSGEEVFWLLYRLCEILADTEYHMRLFGNTFTESHSYSNVTSVRLCGQLLKKLQTLVDDVAASA